MFLLTRRWASCAVLASALTISLSRGSAAQVSTFEACSQGSLNNCATVQLTSQLGIGPGGLNLFQIALQNLGSQTTPNLATSIFTLALLTGQAATPEADSFVTPVAENGATISDPSDWFLAEDGQSIFLSALGTNGIGGCAVSAAVEGVGQMGNTCGASPLITFSFFTTNVFDPKLFTLADIEVSGLTTGLPAESCNDAAACTITPRAPVTATPEPATLLLVSTGLLGLGAIRLRRRTSGGSLISSASEA
jgi:hypothetical protein